MVLRLSADPLPMRFLTPAVFLFVLFCTAESKSADDAPLVRLTFRPDKADGTLGDEQTTEGKIVKETKEGIVVLLDRGGRLWPLTPDRVKAREEVGRPFTPYSQDEMATALEKELGAGFTIVKTPHYVLCSEASREYARWSGMLFERLMAAFERYWEGRTFHLDEPEFPLCAVILRDERRYREFSLEDAGPGVLDALAYYSSMSNRIVMYDLTSGLSGRPPQNVLELNLKLAGQVANVSTIVHEATHQIAFNSGMHVRLADNPLWLAEGMAMFFETPDLKNASGWRTVGALNTMRLRDYREYMTTRRQPGALKSMLTDDRRFQSADTAIDAYAEAWALTYFLVKRKRTEYLRFLSKLQEKEPLEQDEADERVAAFEEAFGKVDELEKEFAKYIMSPGLR